MGLKGFNVFNMKFEKKELEYKIVPLFRKGFFNDLFNELFNELFDELFDELFIEKVFL